MEWYENEKQTTINSEIPQVKMFALNRVIAADQYSTKAIKKWIYCLQKIKSRSEKFPASNIRCYFSEIMSNNNNCNVAKSNQIIGY